MCRITTLVVPLITAFFVVGLAQAQTICWDQPWDRRHASHQSIVESCDAPVPFDLVAMDDFLCSDGGELNALRWWGTIYSKKQLRNRPYYIAIYTDNGRCEPSNKVYEECVTPKTRYVGRDCLGDAVIRFTARIPAFFAEPGQKYWLQISEDDLGSARQGAEDFRWSGRIDVKECPALQRDSSGGITQPLIDPCDEERVDLSFIIGRL